MCADDGARSPSPLMQPDEPIEWIVGRVLDQLTTAGHADPTALRLLVRRFAATARDDLATALGPALGDALAPRAASTDVAELLRLSVDALVVSDDEAVRAAAHERTATIVAAWPSRGRVADAMSGVHAVLTAAPVLDHPDLLSRSIDELERVVGHIYEPGDGVARTIGPRDDTRGDLDDLVACGRALVLAHALTNRLPYAMLAEELMQHARRAWWDEAQATFVEASLAPAAPGPEPPVTDCARSTLFAAATEAAQLLHELARLRRDPDYGATVARIEPVDYERWSRRLLSTLSLSYRTRDLREMAAFGLALEHAIEDP